MLSELCFLRINNKNVSLNKQSVSLVIKELIGENGFPNIDSELLKLITSPGVQFEPEDNIPDIFPDKNYTIDEENKTILGIKLGETTFNEVINIIGKPYEIKYNGVCYKNLGINIYFDEKNKVREFIFSSPYPGKTKKGLRIRDSVDKAYELYGTPNISSGNSVFWKNISIFIENWTVSEIKIF